MGLEPAAKPLVWLHGEIKTPPFSKGARIEAGYLLRRLQRGDSVGLPQARPMPIIGARCTELRVRAADLNWRIICRVDPDAVVIVDVFEKKSRKTPAAKIDLCRDRLRRYDHEG